jgi:hypothetical protein
MSGANHIAAACNAMKPAMIGQGLPRLVLSIPCLAGGLQQVAVMRFERIIADHRLPPRLRGGAPVVWRFGKAIRQRHRCFPF